MIWPGLNFRAARSLEMTSSILISDIFQLRFFRQDVDVVSDVVVVFDSVVVVVDIEFLRVFPRKIFLILIVLVLNRYHYQFQINDIMIRHNWLQFPFKKYLNSILPYLLFSYKQTFLHYSQSLQSEFFFALTRHRQ